MRLDLINYLGEKSDVPAINEQGPGVPTAGVAAAPDKPWKAHKEDILKFWQEMRPNLPINPDPVNPGHKGSRFREDGIRITGSPQYINSIISRLKDLIMFESNPGTTLDLEYRQVEPTLADQGRKTYVFYAHTVTREGGITT